VPSNPFHPSVKRCKTKTFCSAKRHYSATKIKSSIESGMNITDEMLMAAITKTVEAGLLPRRSSGKSSPKRVSSCATSSALRSNVPLRCSRPPLLCTDGRRAAPKRCRKRRLIVELTGTASWATRRGRQFCCLHSAHPDITMPMESCKVERYLSRTTILSDLGCRLGPT
jgi:hypothetical protein